MKGAIKMGRIFVVANRNPKKLEAIQYMAIQVEDFNGRNEQCLLFTEKEWNGLPIIDTKLNLKRGRLYPFNESDFEGFLIKTEEKKDDEWYVVVRKISKSKCELAQNRAKKNPEDLTKKSWLVNLFD